MTFVIKLENQRNFKFGEKTILDVNDFSTFSAIYTDTH